MRQGGTRRPRRSPGGSRYEGYIAICPNLYHRFGPDLAPDDAAAAARAGGWISTEQFLGDAAGALRFLGSCR